MKKLETWKWIWILLLVFYLGKQVDMIRAFGHEPLGHADGFSETNTHVGAEVFIKEGLLASAGLARWPNYDMDTPHPVLKERHIYAHYFPGPEYFLTLWYSLFGVSKESFQWARLIPLLCFFGSVIFLAQTLRRPLFQNWSWGPVIFSAFLFFSPANRYWNLNLHGHAFSTSILLVLLAIGIKVACPKTGESSSSVWSRRVLKYGAICFALGFLSNYMLLTAAFVSCLSPLIGAHLIHHRTSVRPAFFLCFCVGLGLVFAFLVHLGQVAVVLGSWGEAWNEQLHMAIARGGDVREGPTRWMLLGQYSDWVGGFFKINAFFMVFFGVFLAWLHERKNAQRMRVARGVVLAFVSSYLWILVVKNHSIDHPHVNPRIFMPLYVTWVCVLISITADHLINRGQKISTGRS